RSRRADGETRRLLRIAAAAAKGLQQKPGCRRTRHESCARGVRKGRCGQRSEHSDNRSCLQPRRQGTPAVFAVGGYLPCAGRKQNHAMKAAVGIKLAVFALAMLVSCPIFAAQTEE